MQSIGRRTLLKTVGAMAAGGGLSEILLSGCAPAVNTGAKKVLQAWATAPGRYRWHLKAWKLYQQRRKPDFDMNWVLLPFRQLHDMVLITAQTGDGGPDISDIEISQFSRYIKGDVIFVDQTPRLQEAGLLDGFYKPSAIDPWSWQGKVYGIGNQLNTCFLAYRWDLLEKAGIQLPLETWDEFAEAAQRYHRATSQYLIDFPYDDWTSWWMMVLQQRGGFFARDGRQLTIDSAQGLKALAYQKKAIDEGWATLRPSGQSYYTAISTNAIASVIGAPWTIGNVRANAGNTEGKWHAQPLPRWDASGSRTATWGGTGMTILKTSQFIDESWDFIAFENTTPDALYYDFAARQVWPTYERALQDPRLTAPLPFFNKQPVGNLIRQLSPEINGWNNSPFWAETTDAFVRKGVTPSLLQGMAPEAALVAAQREAKHIIDFTGKDK